MSESIENFPVEAQEMIRQLREEAAGHRVAKQEAVKELKQVRAELEAVTSLQDEHEKLLAEFESLKDRHGKVTALLEANYSGPAALELADRVRGENAEEWVADAEKLSRLFAPQADEHAPANQKPEKGEHEDYNPLTDPSAGSATPLNADPTIAKLESLFGA